MDLGNKIVQLRKEKDLNRDELGKAVGTSGAIIGRYERNEITPSVEVAAKIADALDVSLDYLVGNTTFLVKDKKMLYRLELLDKIRKAKNVIYPDEKLQERYLNIFSFRDRLPDLIPELHSKIDVHALSHQWVEI